LVKNAIQSLAKVFKHRQRAGIVVPKAKRVKGSALLDNMMRV
jgi:hypothetical protein